MTSRRRIFAATLAALTLLASPILTRAEPGAPVVLVVGDSISAAYGLPSGTGWVTLLEARLKERGYPQHVVNASISGDTTAGGRARLPRLLAEHRPAIVVIELGGNDGLRGGDLTATHANLDAMVTLAQKARATVLLIGMRLPPNYGPAYTRSFDAIFTTVATAHKAVLLPFFFAGFAERTDMFQPDRIHPTVAAQARLLDNAWPMLEPLLGKRR